tara:strand:- start:93 stop:800 length:708 start_codon:yes stop_codon:yes gene_type:complete
MKKLILYVFLGLLWCNASFADPVEYEDDWYLLDNTETNALEIKDSNGLIKLTVQDQNLILTSNNKTSSIYQFNNDKFDIYLVKKENDLNVIYIFNHTTKTLLAANVDKSGIIFKEMPWEYGLLMAIFKNCEWKRERIMGDIKTNYFLTKYKWKERPKIYKCGYLMFGGRCTLVYNLKTGEYEIGDKMVISDDFKHVGDLHNIKDILEGIEDYNYELNKYDEEVSWKCGLYNKISL